MTKPGEESSLPPVDEHGRPLSPLITRLDEITAAVQRGVRMTLLAHKRLGNPIVVWTKEKGTHELQPEDIPIDDSEFEGETLLPPWG